MLHVQKWIILWIDKSIAIYVNFLSLNKEYFQMILGGVG